MIVHTRVQRIGPTRLRPRNLAPTLGTVAPSSHSAPWHSLLHSPMRVTSASTAQICSGVASTTVSTLPPGGIRAVLTAAVPGCG